jgi:signal transduction histidine kinase
MLSTDSLERQLLDALPITIHALDLDGRLTSVPQTATRFGDEAGAQSPPPAEALPGTSIWDLTGTAFTREQIEHAMHRLRMGRARVVRWELSPVADDRRVLLAQMTPLHDESRAVTGFVVSTTDITLVAREREAATEASLALARATDVDHVYHETAHQLRQKLRPDIIVIAVTDDDGLAPRVVYESGSDGDEKALGARFTATWRSAIGDGHPVIARTGSGVELTAPFRSPGTAGAVTIVLDEVESPERLGDARRFLSTLAVDTATALERAQLVLRTGNRHRSQASGEVATGVAHELRNPIFGISSAAQLLRFRAREDPVMEKNVGRILREVERLNRMVATLMEFGRPIALKVSAADPDTVWDDVLETERGRLESRAIAVRRTRPDAPMSLAIDGEQLAQAFRSVLSNAVDAAPEASDIVLQSATLPNGGWRCRLTNGGEPIAPELLPRVFEPFLSTKPGSTGTGLAFAQRIIDEHDGTIRIESSAQAGTTVILTLPSATRNATLP